MIIDGKLVVSKKRKLALVQELKEKGFKAIPKVTDALKHGEVEPFADNEEEDEEDGAVGAAAYDYLLGMPIWSLTKERVEKLLKQVGDVEAAIDTLIKLSREDLWKRDLDEFLEEWRFQLEDERKSRRKIANMGRRASTKLKIGAAASRKRKAYGGDSDDSEFAGAPKSKKAAAPKAKGGILGDYFSVGAAKASTSQKPKGLSTAAKNAQKLLEMLDTDAKPAPKESQEDDIWLKVDGKGSEASRPIKATSQAPMKKPALKVPSKPAIVKEILSDDESVDEDIRKPTAGRKPRAAATKPVKYNNLSESESDGDDMLFNVGNMVKGISTETTSGDTSRPLFSATMSRPGSSAGLSKRPLSSHKPAINIDADETDYSKLAPPTTKKGSAVTARHMAISDDEDSLDDLPVHKAAKPKAAPKAATKSRAPTKKSIPAAVAPPKKMPLSPAAKAYAAKKAKAEKAALEAENDGLDVDMVANELLDDDDDEVPVRRPARRAAAAAPKKKWVLSDDDDDDEDEETADFEGDDSED